MSILDHKFISTKMTDMAESAKKVKGNVMDEISFTLVSMH